VALALPGDAQRVDALVALRLYLAPLAVGLGRRLSIPRVVVDVDDDDVDLLRSLGHEDEAAAYRRVASCWLPQADAVLAASPIVANAVANRAGIPVGVVPNAVPLPGSMPDPPGADRVLFVGNMSYEPNRVAAQWLGHTLLPALRRRRPAATIDLVGADGGALQGLVGTAGLVVHGAVDEVAEHYAAADVVAVPLQHGSGTRIKVIEAFAHRRPVVATRQATAGLELAHDEAVLTELDDMAPAIAELLQDPARAASMADRAATLASRRYSWTAVGGSIPRLVLGDIAARPPDPAVR
jgi:glycosyltransferase involved in cell wall biosynthesis